MSTTMRAWLWLGLLAVATSAEAGEFRMMRDSSLPFLPPSKDVEHLEENIKYWGADGAVESKWEIQCVEEGALEGPALRCRIDGGKPYTSVYFYRPLLPRAMSSRVFSVGVAFKLDGPGPDTNPSSPVATAPGAAPAPGADAPPVQAVEFLVKNLQRLNNFEWRLQWRSMDVNGPRWFYWDPEAPGGGWVPTDLPADLELGVWHKLVLEGRIWNGKVRYKTIIIDGKTNDLDVAVAPTVLKERSSGLHVGVNFIANANTDPCQMLVDELNVDF